MLDLTAANNGKLDYITNYTARRQMAKDLLDRTEKR